MEKITLDDLGRISIDEFKKMPKTPLVVVLDNIRSALNVGSAFRTADAFLVQELALCGITATPPHREILKTAIGATESVQWQHFETTLQAVLHYRAQGYKIIAIEQTTESQPIHDFALDINLPICVIFGNEVGGVEDAVLTEVDGCIEIPQFGTKHSLNISVCLGIVLWELFRRYRQF